MKLRFTLLALLTALTLTAQKDSSQIDNPKKESKI